MVNKTSVLFALVLSLFLLMVANVVHAQAFPIQSSTPVANVIYVVHHDSDSGFHGYWALDNYTKTITIWSIGNENYVVNATYSGIFCTFAGSKSPEIGAVEPTSGCGIMKGGYEGNLTTSALLNTSIVSGAIQTPSGSPFNYGGTSANILLGVGNPDTPGSFNWLNYLFPDYTSGFAYSVVNGNPAWSWTYTYGALPSISTNTEWINTGAGSTGDIVVPPTLETASITSNGKQIGTLSTGATLVTDDSGSCTGSNGETAACHTLDVSSVSVSNGPLPAGSWAFNLQSSSIGTAALEAYFTAKGWPQNYLTQIDSEIAGTSPFFYFTSDGNGVYSLTDGFHSALKLGTAPLMIDDDYPVGTYIYTGVINGQEETVTLTVASPTLETASITSNGKQIGTLSTGATLVTDDSGSCTGSNGETAACHTLDVSSVSVSNGPLPAGSWAFNLQSSSIGTAALEAYFTAKGWPQNYLTQIDSEIAGTSPFFYFTSDGNGVYSLTDGFHSALKLGTAPLMIDDDYPVGTYIYTGVINGQEETVTLTVSRVPTLTVTASSPSMTYGGAVPVITASYSGFVGSDTSASLTTQPTCIVSGVHATGTYSTTCLGAVDSNYIVTYIPGVLTVNPAPLTMSCSITIVNNKVYDGTTNAPTGCGGALLYGVMPPDVVELMPGGSIFANNQVGTWNVIFSGYALGGADAGDYVLEPLMAGTASITPAPLTVTGITANDKTYDGTTTAALAGTAGLSGSIVSGDDVSLIGSAVGTFTSADAGNDIPITLSGYSLGGTAAGDYALQAPAMSANIAQASTTVSITSSASTSTYGIPITFTATVNPAGGSIPNGETTTFYDNGVLIGTGTTADGVATLVTSMLPAGARQPITATYPGDTDFLTSTSASVSQTVNDAATSGTTETATSGNIVLASSAVGQADMSSGVNNIVLNDNSALDLSDSVQTAPTSVSIASNTVDLTAPLTVGGQSVQVANEVQLNSGVTGTPINITNSALSGVSVSIPDGANILAPSGWTGTITPPTTVTTSGTAPSGFSVGSTAIEVGSSNSILLLSQPATIVIPGVGAVGYKPAGSSAWTQITNVCGGTYASPDLPVFPGECYINNTADTKILSYHFTTFGFLIGNAAPTVPSTGGGGGSTGGAVVGAPGGSSLPTYASYSNGDRMGYEIANFSQDNSETLTVGGTAFTVVENFITPTSAGVTVNGQSLTLSPGAPVQVLNTTGIAYYVELSSVSYLPVLQTVALYLYGQPNNVTAAPQNATPSGGAQPVPSSAFPGPVAPAPVTTAAPANTTAAQPSSASSALPAIAAMGLTIATAIAVGIAYQRRSTGRAAKKRTR